VSVVALKKTDAKKTEKNVRNTQTEERRKKKRMIDRQRERKNER
jgi:hypothetical protein